MAETVHGSDGIPLEGHVEQYATQLWLADPGAFWLHPEGPLSDKTPDEWLAEQSKKRADEEAGVHYIGQVGQLGYPYIGGYITSEPLAQQYQGMLNQQANRSLFGGLPFMR